MPTSDYKNASILVVDDQVANVELLELFLEDEDYRNVSSTTDSRRALELYQELKPDLILLDLHMPHLDGFMVMEQLKQVVPTDTYLPILVLTADVSAAVKERALAGGARDFLTKPLDNVEVMLRIKNLLETRLLHVALQDYNLTLEAKVSERTRDLEAARNEVLQKNIDLQASQLETLKRLALAAEYRDDDTGHHTQRVGRTAALLGAALGLESTEIELLQRAAPLHDVGKIGIPDSVLLTPKRLTDEEFAVMRGHVVIGAQMLSNSLSPLLQQAETIAMYHHERWDGNGYASNLGGEAIPLIARIVAVADVFDALTHERPYKHAWPIAEAVAEINSQRGKQFDPTVVDAFLTLPHEELI